MTQRDYVNSPAHCPSAAVLSLWPWSELAWEWTTAEKYLCIVPIDTHPRHHHSRILPLSCSFTHSYTNSLSLPPLPSQNTHMFEVIRVWVARLISVSERGLHTLPSTNMLQPLPYGTSFAIPTLHWSFNGVCVCVMSLTIVCHRWRK